MPHIVIPYQTLIKKSLFQNLNSKFINETQDSHSQDSIQKSPLIQIALFLDDAAITKFNTGISDVGVTIEEVLGLYMNDVQSIYNHPSLGTHIDFDVTGIYRIPINFDTSLPENNAYPLVINHFCKEIKQYSNLGLPKTWDIAILITGLKVIDQTNPIILGHASGSVCTDRSCIVVRLGGMNLAHALAHEIGHM